MVGLPLRVQSGIGFFPPRSLQESFFCCVQVLFFVAGSCRSLSGFSAAFSFSAFVRQCLGRFGGLGGRGLWLGCHSFFFFSFLRGCVFVLLSSLQRSTGLALASCCGLGWRSRMFIFPWRFFSPLLAGRMGTLSRLGVAARLSCRQRGGLQRCLCLDPFFFFPPWILFFFFLRVPRSLFAAAAVFVLYSGTGLCFWSG